MVEILQTAFQNKKMLIHCLNRTEFVLKGQIDKKLALIDAMEYIEHLRKYGSLLKLCISHRWMLSRFAFLFMNYMIYAGLCALCN